MSTSTTRATPRALGLPGHVAEVAPGRECPCRPCQCVRRIILRPGRRSLGLDLNPIDLRSADDTAWLETLVWPGQEERIQGLRAAIDIARFEVPKIVRGNLLTDLEPLIATAPNDATLVVFHTAVLAYVTSQERRDQFAETVRNANAVWISNEVPGVFPSFATAASLSPARGRFLMMLDGTAVAWTGPHGQSIDWLRSP